MLQTDIKTDHNHRKLRIIFKMICKNSKEKSKKKIYFQNCLPKCDQIFENFVTGNFF